MRFRSALVLGISVLAGRMWAQDCAPVARIPAAGTLSGALDAASCRLLDGTPYAAYRLDLPVRGQIQIELNGNSAGFLLILRDAGGNKVDSGAGIARAIEAGSYTLLVNGAKPGQTGDYKLTATFTAEAGMLCNRFANIGRSQAVDGLLPGSGCLAPDGSAYEAYMIGIDGAGTLTIAVDSTDFAPLVSVRSIDGTQLAPPAASPVNIAVNADSQYVIVIGSADKTGAYRVTTSFQTAGGETCDARRSFTASGSDANAIGADSCFVTIAGSGDQSYYNYYDLTIPGPGLVDASAVSGDFSATLNLLDAAGNLLASNSGGAGYDAQGNLQSSLRAQLSAGNYRLQVFSDVPTGGAYSLQYVFQPGNPTPCTAAALHAGDAPTGTLSADSCRTGMGISDVYTLTLGSAGTVDLDMSASAFDTILVIRDSKDNLIVRNDDVDGVDDAHITADLPAGAYTVVAAASSGSGSYRLAARFSPHDIAPCTFAQSLDLNGGYIQRLGTRSCRASNGQPVDYYTFTLPADALVLAVITSSEIDGFLTLYDAAGNVLRTDDNSYGSDDPLIVQYLPAGTYKLAARDASSTLGGLYEIDLRTTTGPRPPFCTPRSVLTPGATVTGEIRYTGCQYSDNTFADLYQITLPADATLDIRADSTDFDAYLVLLDSKGAAIDEDDDSGGNTNAHINHALAAGTYTIVVKPLGDYTSHGAYTLTTR
jgi:hypothetical protein